VLTCRTTCDVAATHTSTPSRCEFHRSAEFTVGLHAERRLFRVIAAALYDRRISYKARWSVSTVFLSVVRHGYIERLPDDTRLCAPLNSQYSSCAHDSVSVATTIDQAVRDRSAQQPALMQRLVSLRRSVYVTSGDDVMVFAAFCHSVCLSVCKISKKNFHGLWWHFWTRKAGPKTLL